MECWLGSPLRQPRYNFYIGRKLLITGDDDSGVSVLVEREPNNVIGGVTTRTKEETGDIVT